MGGEHDAGPWTEMLPLDRWCAAEENATDMREITREVLAEFRQGMEREGRHFCQRAWRTEEEIQYLRWSERLYELSFLRDTAMVVLAECAVVGITSLMLLYLFSLW